MTSSLRLGPTHALLAVAGAVIAGACGGDPSREPPPVTRLTVSVHPQGSDGPVHTRTIACEGEDRTPACRGLSTTALAEFAPVPPDRICTAVYGGPATATAEGRMRGRRLEAHFALHDGCEIARWERFAWLLGEPPG